MTRATPQRDHERALWARIETSRGLNAADPLQGHPPCDLCQLRGPLKPLWWLRGPAALPKALPFVRTAEPWESVEVCADGCAEALEVLRVCGFEALPPEELYRIAYPHRSEYAERMSKLLREARERSKV